ncbi:MAG: Kelch repeat-containing protein [Polyangiales bacterium]
MRRMFFLLAIVSGCASSTEDDVLTTRHDSGTTDSTPEDTAATDTGTPDTTPSCVGKEGATCKPGDTRSSACGNCGTVTDTCDPDTCTWNPGTCKDEGCAAGSTETADCTTAGEKKTRTCDATCKWSDYSTCKVPTGWVAVSDPPADFAARALAVCEWTGKELVIWGGNGSIGDGKTGTLTASGAAYDPKTDTWRTLSKPPTEFANGRSFAATTSANEKVYIWGGQDGFYQKNGVIYDAAADTWKLMSASTLPEMSGATAVWSTTTHEMLIWSAGNGAHYDPATDKWTAMPAAPIGSRTVVRAVWAGSKMVIWGGCPATGCATDGAAYDPVAKTWTKLATPPVALEGRGSYAGVAADGKLLMWGGYNGTTFGDWYKKTGATYDPATDLWSMISSPSDTTMTPRPGREGMSYWYGGGKLFVFGGFNLDAGAPTAWNGGSSYDTATDTWAALPTKDAPAGRADACAAWTGEEAIVWGGWNLRYQWDRLFRDGARFRP